MNKKIIRHNFNMVEIMLAVIVIALGIAGTFVLFPVGLNANKEATAENSIADIAEYVISFVRAQCMTSGIDSSKEAHPFVSDSAALQNIFCDKDDLSKITNAVIVDNLSSADGWKPASGSASDTVDLKKDVLLKMAPGIYLYRQFSGSESDPYVDFSAIARVYVDNTSSNANGFNEEYFINLKGENTKYSALGMDDNIRKFIIPVVLELSWPATVPEAEREKRYFRFEIFNDQYEMSKESTP